MYSGLREVQAQWAIQNHRSLFLLLETDGSATSHGTCKPCSELSLSQEPRSTDAEGGGYAELLATMYVYALSS
jgi:hypothetical protein